MLQMVALHQLLGVLRQIHIRIHLIRLGEPCSLKAPRSDRTWRAARADLRFQLQVYPHVFNQYVDKSSQQEDQGQDAGPLDNQLLVLTQHLSNDFEAYKSELF